MGGLPIRISLYAAVLAAGGVFSTLFVEGSGRALLTMLGAAVAGLFVGSSGRLRFLLLPPVTALYALLAVYGRMPLSREGWRELFAEGEQDVYEAAETMYFQTPPYEPAPGILVLLVPVAILIVAFATSAALYEGIPLISFAVLGTAFGIIATVNLEDGIGPYFAVFLASSVALLLFSGTGESVGGPGLVAAVLVVGAVLALPEFAGAAIRPPLVDWTRLFAGTGGTSGLSVQADVGEYLTAGRDAELLRVRSDEPLYWRGGTLDHFDGARWSDTSRPEEAGSAGEEIAPGVETDIVRQSVEVLDARTEVVFGGYRIRASSLPDARRNSDGSWSVDEPLSSGSYYEVISEVPQPTRAQLMNAGTTYPAQVRERYLQLPAEGPAVIGETARDRCTSSV